MPLCLSPSLFHYIKCYYSTVCLLLMLIPFVISIHLMLLFNQIKHILRNRNKSISIHLMLLFNRYNLLLLPPLLDFNTSNVTIQPWRTRRTGDRSIISIHLMLLFNIINFFYTITISHFNTSNVTIQRYVPSHPKLISGDFNTSNVTIQLTLLLQMRLR